MLSPRANTLAALTLSLTMGLSQLAAAQTKPTTTTTLKGTTTTTVKGTTTTTVKGATTTTVKGATTTTVKGTTTTTINGTTTTTINGTTTTTINGTTTTLGTTTTTASTKTQSSTTTTEADTTTTTSTVGSTTTTTLPHDVCGNCLDDDGDGLVDFEDPDCCTVTSNMTVRQAVVRPGEGTTRTALRSCLDPDLGPLVNPLVQDTYVQIRNARQETVFCGFVNHEKFMRLTTRTVAFWDRSGKVTSARGIQDMWLKRGNKCLGVYVFGKKVQYLTETGENLRVTVAFQNPDRPEESVCATTTSALVAGNPLRTSSAHR